MNLLDNTDPVIDPNKDYYDELVGEGKKYNDRAAFARSRLEADLHISRIEKENAEIRADYLKMREEAAAKAKLEDLIDQLSKRQIVQDPDITPVRNIETPKPIKPEEIESLIDTRMERREAERRELNNFNSVKAKLTERYGTNYSSTVKEQIDDLGITVEEFNTMAKKQPKVLLRTLGLDQEIVRDPFQAPQRATQRSDNFAPRGAAVRSWSFYEKMRKDDPGTYHKPKTQLQMHKDAAELGDKFRDGDFNA